MPAEPRDEQEPSTGQPVAGTPPCTCGSPTLSVDDILTATEVASLFGLDKKTVYAAVQRGELPAKRIGHKLLFSQRVLLEWWTSQGRAVSERK